MLGFKERIVGPFINIENGGDGALDEDVGSLRKLQSLVAILDDGGVGGVNFFIQGANGGHNAIKRKALIKPLAGDFGPKGIEFAKIVTVNMLGDMLNGIIGGLLTAFGGQGAVPIDGVKTLEKLCFDGGIMRSKSSVLVGINMSSGLGGLALVYNRSMHVYFTKSSS